MEGRTPKRNDIIEIVESIYEETLPIGNRYVVVECFDGYDVWIIDEKGQYTGVCGEDFKIVGTVDEERRKFVKALHDRDRELIRKNNANQNGRN